jgi:ORF6N domain
MSAVFPSERIEQTILLLRGHKIILDRDLAAMYGVSTRDLNKSVSRNLDRFPDDFMLQLTRAEFNDLKFQFGTSSWGGTRKLPRAFVKLREFAASHKTLAMKLEQLERKVGGHDGQIRSLFDAIRQLMEPPTSKSRRIGFKA